MLDDHVIRDIEQKEYSKEDFLKRIQEYNMMNYRSYIGTDSKIVGDQISICTVICFHGEKSCGKVFSMKTRIPRSKYPSLRARMLLEAYRSIELALEVDKYLNDIEIHLDVGDTIKNKTSAYERELTSLVLSQGYECKIKPYSWASSAVADRVVKN